MSLLLDPTSLPPDPKTEDKTRQAAERDIAEVRQTTARLVHASRALSPEGRRKASASLSPATSSQATSSQLSAVSDQLSATKRPFAKL